MRHTKAFPAPKHTIYTGLALTEISITLSKVAITARTDHLPSNVKEPMISKPVPERPFQQIAADFGSYGGRKFLIIVDCMTDWPDIVDMGKDTSAVKLTATLRDHFCHAAAPDLLWSDGGPQFTSSELKPWGVPHSVSSPHYPQSNGKVEATVKSMKKLDIGSLDRLLC